MEHVKLNLVQPKWQKPVAWNAEECLSEFQSGAGADGVPLEYEDILAFCPPNGISRQRVLIEGLAGSGKSTLVQKMCHDWSISRIAQDYKTVILVALRSLPKDHKLCLEDLILTSVGDRDIVQEVAGSIITHRGYEVLFILDGLDELSEDMREKSLVVDIIKGHILPQSSFVVTSRPISAESVRHFADRRVVVSGFGENEVEDYITKYFASSNRAAGEKLMASLSLYPHIKRLCYVPLLLMMVCYIVSHGGDSAELPHTLHQLFEYLIILTLNHNLERAGRKERTGSLEDVRRLCPSFKKLIQLALEGIEKDIIIFSELDFEVDSSFHGIFNCIVSRNRFGVIQHTWHFMHLVVQEFMAALAVTSKTPEEQVAFWKQHLILQYNKEGHFIFTQDRYHNLFLFYSGLSGLHTPGIQSMLLDTLNTVARPSIRWGTPLPELCSAIAESGNEDLAQSILSPCGSTVEISRHCLKDVNVAWCVIAYCKKVDGAGIRIKDGYGVANFISQLGDISSLAKVELSGLDEVDDLLSIGQFLLKQRQLKTVVFGELEDVKRTEDVDGMGDEVDTDIISTVKGVLTQQRESLQEVALWGKYLRAPPLDPLVNPLVTCQRLTSFELAWSALSLQSLLAVVERLHNLRALSLVGIILSNEAALTASDALLVASSVEHHPHLRELTVKLCSVFLVKGGVEGMTRRHGVEKLVITPFMQRRASSVDPALVPPICATMHRGSLKTLGIGELSKPDHVVQVLEELSHCTQLRELELKLKIPQLDLDLSQSDEVVTLPSAVEAGLSKCTTLQKLTVRGSTSSVTAAFLKGVTVSRSLKEVTLAGCNYDGIDNKVAFFLSDLKQAPQLRKIEMTDCQYLSPSLIATLCGGLYTSNSIEEVEVALWRFTSKVEDVLDTDLLKAVEAAVKSSLSMKRIKIQGEFIKWTNVATAILKGAAQSTSLRELELETPEEFPPPQEVIDDVRKAKPELRLVVMSGNNCSCFSTYL